MLMATSYERLIDRLQLVSTGIIHSSGGARRKRRNPVAVFSNIRLSFRVNHVSVSRSFLIGVVFAGR